MATALKLRRGTTTQHSTFTGAEGEITVDTTKDTAVVHDGTTAGGFPLVTETGSQTLTNKTLASPVITGASILPAGSASAPAITTTGDTNTGIFFPAADTIAFSEGGAEAMRIDSSGNLLVGTTSPLQSSQLTVYASPTPITTIDRTTNIGATVSCASSGTGYIQGGVRLGTEGNSGIYGYDDGASGAQGIGIFTGNNTTIAERMRINSSGAIGLNGANFGTSGQVLTSGGSAAAPSWTTFTSYGGFSTVIFASSGTWAVPSGITKARITVIGGGGAGRTNITAASGGSGGVAVAYCTGISGTLTITVGVGQANATALAGGTSSVTGTGVSISATGGAGATSGSNGANGVGTVTTGTALRTSSVLQAITLRKATYLLTNGALPGELSTGTAALVWSPSADYTAGAGGGTTGSSGSVGGAVIIEY